jgi:hypothetical protein
MDNTQDSDVEDELTQRIVAVLRRRRELSFDESVREYRQVEAEFVERAGENEAKARATKQSITNHLLMEAERTEQPHEVCRDIWEELVHRGFLTMELRHVLSRTYARCCQYNGEFDAGIEVLDSRIAELEQLLQESTLTPENRFYCDENIRMHNEIRDELKAGIRK